MTRTLTRSYLLGSLLLAAAACGEDGLDLATPDQCNPLGGARCMTPWPSSIYEVDDATTATGRRLALPPGALPTNIDGIPIAPELYNIYDGASSAAPPVIAFSTGVDDTNLVHYTNIEDSLGPNSPTVLIDMVTGQLVPHWAEVDARGADTPASQALFIRSTKLLEGGRRYAVAIKKTAKGRGGVDLPIPEGFAAIVSGEKTTHPLLEKVRPRYPEIFAALETHGIAKEDLVVAWDFTTQSRETVRADLYDARAAALAVIGPNAANLDFEILGEPALNDTRFRRRINGRYDAPLFLTNGGSFAPSTQLQRAADGKPMATGTYKVPFTAMIPECAYASDAPVPVIVYGHGLLGQAIDQVPSSGMRNAAAEVCAIAIGTDMRGMSSMDVPNVILALNDANKGYGIFDVLVQGMMNHVALSQIVRGPMAARLFTKTVGDQTVSMVDGSKIYWYGISQGGIMGTTVCAIDPLIEKCVVQVGAINYSLLLERSRDWPQYRTTLIGAYPDALDAVLLINLLQQKWDRTEPAAVADVITTTGFPDTPPKKVLMQIGVADDEVANLGSDYQARTMGIPVVTPSPYVSYGLQGQAGPVPSGMVIYDFGLGATIPPTNEAPPDNNVHGLVRNKKATTDMMKAFYETGLITNTCTAPNGCDCTVAGACGADL